MYNIMLYYVICIIMSCLIVLYYNTINHLSLVLFSIGIIVLLLLLRGVTVVVVMVLRMVDCLRRTTNAEL